MLNAEQVDAIFTAMSDFEKVNFGCKHGMDFPAIAQALINSEKFKSLALVAAMMGTLGAMLIPRKKDGTGLSEDEVKRFLDDHPIKGILAETFYAGYQTGKAVAETEKLEVLAR